ncbi:hypothetical protein MMC08_007199 [Hypocenomyce scalaris]|nr:hypothetical protein [Hypocenomyce scalaris]
MSLSILENLNCTLPHGHLPENIDNESIFAEFRDTLSSLNAASFAPDALWRDMFALTGSIRTFYGVDNITQTWRALTQTVKPQNIVYLKQSSQDIRLGEANWIEGAFSFEIHEAPARTCVAVLSLVPTDDGKWRIWVLRTFLDNLKSHPSVDKLTPARRLNGESKTARVKAKDKDAFACVVVGAGQAGLSVAGRLQSQGIDYVMLEKNGAVGDSWKKRYNSTKCKLNYCTITKLWLTTSWEVHTTRESCKLIPRFKWSGIDF